MKLSLIFSSLIPVTLIAAQKYVFAHVVVGTASAHTVSTWANDIALASAARIDAFALNIAYPDPNIPTQVSNAFAAAASLNSTFKLFFSFDYLGGGQAWPATSPSQSSQDGDSVAWYLQKYGSNPAYFQYSDKNTSTSKPFVSTFEGVDNINDWAPNGAIRSAVGDVYFVPNWGSLGTSGISTNLNNMQGFFSWDMWPNGANDMNSSSGGDGKKWIWRGDDLWHERWQQVVEVNPDFVEIVTWNDFAEGHFIGPVYSPSEIAVGSDVYLQNITHQSWLSFVPYYISLYKGTSYYIPHDMTQFWYRLAPAAAGDSCGVTGNTAAQQQTEMPPAQMIKDAIFFSALLQSAAQVQLSIGGQVVATENGVQGINHWSQEFGQNVGAVELSVSRGGQVVNSTTGPPITSNSILANGCSNYNAWVGGF
ncbi:hypothetical protein B7494_g1977 [Chlorociboria aeruginascens]|nr:hypothetical protein B7494_g1977 [Chlorociboria aeruginascens]